MDNPGFLIEEVEPGIEGGIGIKVAKGVRKLETAGFEFGAEKVDDGITPHGFEGGMIEINFAHPAFAVRSQTASGGGKMDMEITFEIAAESMHGGIDAREERFFYGQVNDNAGGDRCEFVEKMTVKPEERLQMIR